MSRSGVRVSLFGLDLIDCVVCGAVAGVALNLEAVWRIDDTRGYDFRTATCQRSDGGLPINWDLDHLVFATVSRLGPSVEIHTGEAIVLSVRAARRSDRYGQLVTIPMTGGTVHSQTSGSQWELIAFTIALPDGQKRNRVGLGGHSCDDEWAVVVFVKSCLNCCTGEKRSVIMRRPKAYVYWLPLHHFAPLD